MLQAGRLAHLWPLLRFRFPFVFARSSRQVAGASHDATKGDAAKFAATLRQGSGKKKRGFTLRCGKLPMPEGLFEIALQQKNAALHQQQGGTNLGGFVPLYVFLSGILNSRRGF
jgi:hypothetical protein